MAQPKPKISLVLDGNHSHNPERASTIQYGDGGPDGDLVGKVQIQLAQNGYVLTLFGPTNTEPQVFIFPNKSDMLAVLAKCLK